jgi:UDP-N-acetylmuramoyl-tripeptide--D-alanyl-D-alanine ligase
MCEAGLREESDGASARVNLAYMFAAIDYDLFTVRRVCAPEALHLDSANTRLTSVTTSSLEARAGSLFVPLVDRRDGHEFIADAVARGAAAFFLKQDHAMVKRMPQQLLSKAILVEDPLKALGDFAHFHRSRFAPFVVAVTGSNGKTTTKEMLAQMFKAALGKGLISTEKNYNNHIGVPFTLLRIGSGTRVAVIEMGMNHAGEIAYLSRLAMPHAAVISSIGHAHIEFLGSRRAIAAAKAEILEGLPKGGFLYLPKSVAEAEVLAAAAKRAGARVKKVEASRTSRLKVLSVSPKGFSLQLGDAQTQFKHANAAWLSNLALAAEVALDAGIEPEKIARAIASFRPAAGRMQLRRGRLTVIDDGYNANPDSAIASIDSAMLISGKNPVVCVFGEFKELGKHSKSLHTLTGHEAAVKGVAAFYAMGKDMRHAVSAFKKASGGRDSAWFDRADTAGLAKALQKYPRGTVVLVKGSRSMKMEEIVDLLV